jgi:hypothetical protein
MTERRSKFDLEVEERVRVQQRAEAYDRDERERAELDRIEGQRDELAANLKSRGERYVETTGESPPRSVLEGWQREYVDATHAEQQAERQRRVEAARNQVF